MPTYRKDIKEQNHQSLLTNGDTLYQGDARDYVNTLHNRMHYLVGFTVASILIGAAALAISVLLLVQSIVFKNHEMTHYESLQMKVNYLKHMVESLEKLEINNKIKHEPPLPPQPPLPPLPPSQPPQLTAITTTTTTTTTRPPPPPPSLPKTSQPQQERTIITDSNGVTNHDKISDLPKPPIDDEENGDWAVEGSGEYDFDCPANPPRPHCPIGMRICQTKERCPKYVCCRH